MNSIKPINRRITVEDLETPEWKDIVLEMHSMMKVPREKMHKFAYCTDRRGLVYRAEFESFKHWEYPWLIKHGEFRPGAKILDCGCGRGILQFYLARKGYNIISVDISTLKTHQVQGFWNLMRKSGVPVTEDQASAMNGIARRYDVSIDFRVANIAKLPFEDEAFDYVYSVSVLEHMAEGEDVMAIKEMSRVLKKGGTMLVTVDFSPVKMERKAYIKEDIFKLISASGLYFDNMYDFEIQDWRKHLAELDLAFSKKNKCQVSSAAFVLKKTA
ncbi:MAG: class I SAM-dependent methyltransferase [Elusimicrobia bacterium]|nr:class I SAM-dependent methyltransferase [Elusimicrobiota bacterium]